MTTNQTKATGKITQVLGAVVDVSFSKEDLPSILTALKVTNASINDFETFIGDNGDILLSPRTAIPTRELWVHQNPEILKSIQKGIQDTKEGRVTRTKNLDKFFKEL